MPSALPITCINTATMARGRPSMPSTMQQQTKLAPIAISPESPSFFRGLKKRVLIVGTGLLAMELGRTLVSNRRTVEVVGFLDRDQNGNPKVLGTYDNLREIVEQYQVGMIAVCIEDRRAVLPVQALLDCKTVGIEVIDGHQM